MDTQDELNRADLNRAVALRVFGYNSRVYKGQVLYIAGGKEVELPDYCGSWDAVRPLVEYLVKQLDCTSVFHYDGSWWKAGAYRGGKFYEVADKELPVAVCGVALQIAGEKTDGE